MNFRAAPALLCTAAVFASSAGCQSVQKCCTSFFASRSATYADTTPVPEKSLDVQTVAHDEESTGTAGRAEGDNQDQSARPHRRFNIPEELPGSNAAPLVMPPMDATESIEQRRSLADALFPEVTPAEVRQAPDAGSPPLTLATMQQMAVENSPVLRQAAATVEQARGKAVQSGLCPNPTVGYQGDTIGTARTAGYNGVFFSQEFVTAGKLTLAQNVALHEMRAAQADLRKARIKLASDVRRNYFKVLIAQEQLKFNRAIAKLSAEVYKAQIDLVTGGESAPYEPLQLRVFAVQARNTVTQSANTLDASWRQLVAAVGIPHMTRQNVAGSVELPVPEIDYETLVTMLQRHSDLNAANARIASSGSNLRLQEAVPVPNVTLYAAFQHDDTTPLSDYSTNVQLSAPIPVFNRNQGNITTAHAELVRARQDLNDVNNTLMSQLAETYNRYSTSRTISESYRTDLLPDQVRVYRGVYDRFLIDGESIDFAQVVVAQQTLAQVVTSYLQSLTDSWMATVDLAELLQVDDLMTMDGMTTTANSSTSVIDDSAVPVAPAVPAAPGAETAPQAAAQPGTEQQEGFDRLSLSAAEVSSVSIRTQDSSERQSREANESTSRSVEEDLANMENSATKRKSRRPTPRMIDP